jgi:hypothetical protein
MPQQLTDRVSLLSKSKDKTKLYIKEIQRRKPLMGILDNLSALRIILKT